MLLNNSTQSRSVSVICILCFLVTLVELFSLLQTCLDNDYFQVKTCDWILLELKVACGKLVLA